MSSSSVASVLFIHTSQIELALLDGVNEGKGAIDQFRSEPHVGGIGVLQGSWLGWRCSGLASCGVAEVQLESQYSKLRRQDIA